MNNKNLNKLGRKVFNKTAVSRVSWKKPIPISISEPITEETLVKTLEGDVKAPVGYRVVTGVKGEKYPIDNEVFKQYNRLEDGTYIKSKTLVRAMKLEHEGRVRTPWGAILNAKKGDFLIMESKKNMWVIDEDIFNETYVMT